MFYTDSCPHMYVQMRQQFDEITHLSMVEPSLVSSLHSTCSLKKQSQKWFVTY